MAEMLSSVSVSFLRPRRYLQRRCIVACFPLRKLLSRSPEYQRRVIRRRRCREGRLVLVSRGTLRYGAGVECCVESANITSRCWPAGGSGVNFNLQRL